MTVQIDTTAEIDAVRLKTEGAHPAAPSSGHVLLYYVTGTANPGLYTEFSGGQKAGPFITGTGGGAFVAPATSGWTWDNQSTSTLVSVSGEEAMAADSGGSERRIRYRTPVNSHWRITVQLSMIGGNGSGMCCGFRDSNGKLVQFDLYNSGTLYIMRWNSTTSFNSAATSLSVVGQLSPLWFRLEYDGTNITFYYSLGGLAFHQFYTETLTTFLAAGTPDFEWGANVIGGAIKVSLNSFIEEALP